jgi:hypothetical protein
MMSRKVAELIIAASRRNYKKMQQKKVEAKQSCAAN